MTQPAGADRRPLAFLLVGLTALAAVAWTPLRELRGALVATEFARAIASGDSARLALVSSPDGVRSALCVYRETDVRRWPWASGAAAQRGRETPRGVEFAVSVRDGRALHVLVTPGWRPAALGVSFDRTVAADTATARFDRCAVKGAALDGGT